MENLFNEEILVQNIKAAAYFILLYEHFEDLVISCVQEFYSNFCMIDGVPYSSIDDKYISVLKEKVNSGEENPFIPYKRLLWQAEHDKESYKRDVLNSKSISKEAKKLRGSLIWLCNNGVFQEFEVERIFQIRNRRNNIVHELLSVLGEGLTEEDALMIADLLEYHGRVNNWLFQNIDMPVMGIELPDDVVPEDVISGDDAALMGIFRILFYGEGEEFKEALKNGKRKQWNNMEWDDGNGS